MVKLTRKSLNPDIVDIVLPEKNLVIKTENVTSMLESQAINRNQIFSDKYHSYVRNILPISLLQTSVVDSTTKGKDSSEYYNVYCREISKKLWLPTKIDSADLDTSILNGFLNNTTQKSMQSVVKQNYQQEPSSQKTLCQSWGFSTPDITEHDTMITRKVKIGLTDYMKEKLKPMFKASEYYYNKTINHLKTNYFHAHVKCIVDQFIKSISKQVIEYTLINEDTAKLLVSKLVIGESRITLKYKYIKMLSDNFKLPSKFTICKDVFPTKMANTHVEYWTTNTPSHAKEHSVFEAITNYSTAICNYSTAFIIRIISAIRTKEPVIFKEFGLTDKVNSCNLHIKNRTIKFNKNMIMPKSFTRIVNGKSVTDKYTISSDTKHEIMKLIRYKTSNIHESKLIKDNLNYYLHLVITVRKIDTKPKYNTCALDPGVRTFQTVYSPDGIVAKLGDATNKMAVKIMRRISKYNSALKHDKKDRKNPAKTKRRIQKRLDKTRRKLKNRVNDLHKKSAKYLTDNFSTIIIPETNISDMVRKYKRNINKTTVNGLLSLSHYRFRMRLLQLAKRTNTNVLEVSEAYTSKTCGHCGYSDKELAGKKIYSCKCGYTCDRDIHGARNIYIRAVNNIWVRTARESPPCK